MNMRVYVRCKSPLLQKTIEKYLKDIKSDRVDICDFCVSDKRLKNHKTFIIGKDIKHPFTKDELISSLKEFHTNLSYKETKEKLSITLKELKKIQSKKIEDLVKRLS
jgi:hypothetical protein